MTGYSSVNTARQALLCGAVDYIVKPFSVEHDLKPLIARVLETSGADEDATDREVGKRLAVSGIDSVVGQSAAIRSLIEKARKIARSDAPVLLRGESGTGKEVFADLIHRLSDRCDRPLVKVNCAALPEALLESELFGFVKGAFTGAAADREGLFQAADGGPIFLDEIGEISLTFQPKLLHVLQNGEFHRIGDARRTTRVNVRVLAATNCDLEGAIRAGMFRKDLYYRLNVVPLDMPPLREHIDDLPNLLQHFSESLSAGERKPFSDAALDAMQSYSWPGNIRELSNAVAYALVMGESDRIEVTDLPVSIQDHVRVRSETLHIETAETSGDTLEEIEMRCILQAMRKTGFNRTKAARLLGVTRRTLGYRIRKYDLEGAIEKFRDAPGAPGPAMAKVPPPRSGVPSSIVGSSTGSSTG
jgi:DNA-binding NtrC family response regulator